MLYVASQSPRRRQLLEQAGIRFDTVDIEVPEVRAPGEPPADYVSRVAREKAGAGLLKLAGVAGAVVLGADTEVVLGDEVFGKPADAAHATAMLRRLSGRSHQAISAVWCVSAGREERALSVSEVAFAALSESAIAACRQRRADRQGRRLRDPGTRCGIHKPAVGELFGGHGLALVRNRGTVAPVRDRSCRIG